MIVFSDFCNASTGSPNIYNSGGQAQALFRQRVKTLDAAFAANPIRFKRNCPQPPKLPVAAWINPPKKEITLNKKPSNCTLN